MTTNCVIIIIIMNMYDFIYNHVILIMVIVEKMVAT